MNVRATIVGILPLASLAGVVGCGASQANPSAEESITGAGQPVERRDLDVRAEAPGQVEPVRVVEVKSKASGEILALHAETGDRVERSALLAEVDPRDVSNALSQAEADIEVARVQARIAEEQRERSEELLESEIITEQEYESAELEAANAQASLVRAETNLQLARERMGDVTIRAPITGTVIERGVEAGQLITSATSNVSGGTVLLRMADLSEVQVRTLVDETDIGRIEPGQTARVEVEAFPGRTFTGEVLKIEPQAVVEQNVTMFPVLIRLENPRRLLKPGMNAEVTVQIARRPDVLAVPNATVVGPRDAADLASALGISEESARAALRPADGPGAAANGDGGGDLARRCQELRAAIRDGGPGALSADDRATMRECRELLAGGGREDEDGERPGVVFVRGPDGPELRRVTLGVSDWEYTEVVEGLEEDEEVLQVSVLRLMREQEEMTDRIRERTGGPFRDGS